MGRRRGQEKKTYKAAPTSRQGQPTVFARASEARTGGATGDADAKADFNTKTGELPLFYATSPKLAKSRPISRICKIATNPHRLTKGKSEGQGSRREVGADVHLGEGDAEWPPVDSHGEEITNWASSFRFELDTQDTGRLQVMLERNARSSGRNLTHSQNWTETPGGSFRFRNEELGGNLKPKSHLKPPRQLQGNIHDSNKVIAIAATTNGNGSESQAGPVDATLQPSDFWDVVPFEAPRNVAVDVPNSPERAKILRRLNELKAAHQSASSSLIRFGLDDITNPSLLRFGSPTLEDVLSYHKEMAKLAARRDQFYQSLKTDSCEPSSCTSPLSKSITSTPIKKVSRQSQETTTKLGELEIMPITIERKLQSTSSPSGPRGSPRRTEATLTPQELRPITPTTSKLQQSPRRSSTSRSIQDHIVSIRKLQFFSARATSNVSNNPSPDHTPFLSAARGSIPFTWEEEPGKPKTVANAANAQRLSREESNCAEGILQLSSSHVNIVPESVTVVEVCGNGGTQSARSSPDGGRVGNGDGGRVESHRYYGREHLRGHSETSLGQSSRRHGTQEGLEAQIDLDASAAAKFLVELYDTPLSTPGRPGSSPLFAVPFKWEDTPGKAKAETPVGRHNMLQLPPRLAVASHHSAESFSFRASHPFATFFAPCLTASSSGQQQRKHSDRVLLQFGSGKSLPPRAPNSPSPPERRKRHGLVGRCYSSPQEGCQVRMSKSTAGSPVLQAVRRDFFRDETKTLSGTWVQKTSSNPNGPSSPRSILCGPGEGSSSQNSASNALFSSGDLEALTRQTNHSRQSASKSSNSSFESIEEDFTEFAFGNSHLYSSEPQAPPEEASPNAIEESLLNLSKTEKQKTQAEIQVHRTQSPEPAAWSPALADYFQSFKLTEAASTSTPAISVSKSRSDGASTRSGNLNSSEGEVPLAPKPALPTLQSMLLQKQPPHESPVSAQASPMRPTRLPYTMPSVAEQLLASCDTAARRLVHDLSPRLLRQCSGRNLTRSSYGHNSGGGTHVPRVERYNADEVCHTSPVYAAALQILSPQRQRTGRPKPLTVRPRRRARFMVSICKTLKRLVLGRQRRCNAIERFEPKLMYD